MAKKDQQQNAKAAFLKKLGECTNEDDKKKLMSEHDDLNDKINKEIDKMSFDGALLLEAKAGEIISKQKK